MKNKKLALAKSLLALLLCMAMLVSTTFAWFTDSVVSGINTIAAGNLDVELYHSNAAVTNQKVTANTQLFLDLQGNPILWEPGVVSYENLRVTNEGDLALIYQMAINTANENYILDNGAQYGLSQVLKVGMVEGGITATDRDGVVASVNSWTTLSAFLCSGSLLADGEETWGVVIYWQPGDNDNNWNANNGKQLSSGDALSIDLGIKLTATQEMYENDAFGNDYDVSAKDDVFPSFGGGSASTPIEVGADNRTTAAVTIAIGDITATIPAGVLVEEGIDKLTLTVKTLSTTSANVVLGEDEAIRSLDVHVEGVSADNDTPITVTLPEVAPVALNMGNYNVYHVENGATNEMTLVASNGDFDAHNQYKYDPATGDVVLYMATFSEVALTADTEKGWEGNRDYSWYDVSKAELTIANADQLTGFSAIVGGMAEGIAQDSFSGKTVKLIADINLADAENNDAKTGAYNNDVEKIFYPIGYSSSDGKYEKTGVAVTTGFYNFCGTFDGNGHTIANFYHNTWEMKGDHNWYAPEDQYYRDGMGLFGRVYGATIKNLTVDNFSCDGEIATTGVIAAYAEGSKFENIAVTNCNPRVYNIGNGGIVGCVGWYAKEANLVTTFTNITVDNTNKISALWGSYDVPCGGIVGQYYPTSGQTSAGTPKNAGIDLINCHVSAVMDVNNDVCGNYQYYAYRYAGLLIGSVRENVTIDGHVYPDMTNISAENCTVHFGTWNDYYYCEFEKNGHPSYSGPDDYKFSRVPHSELNFTDSNGNGVIDTKEERDSVTGCKHNHTAAEDNQAIYLPFNNLVTGYGWGVTSLGLNEYHGVTNLDVTEGHEDSVTKFESVLSNDTLDNNKAYKLGDIFKFVNNGVELVPGALIVSVNNLDATHPVSAKIDYNRNGNWTDGTITFYGNGEVTLTIQDYYFCKPTTIKVTIGERQKAEKFDVVMNNGDFLHRVGNVGTVALNKLFEAKDGASVGTISVVIENVAGNAGGTISSNPTLSNGSIKFSGTGVVKVTITDNDYCIATELYLEVIDATNLTSATGTTTGGTFVLLCDVNTSTYVNYYNSTLYGNGFTYSLKGAPTAYNSKQGHGVIITQNTTLDNVVFVGDVYNSYGAYTNQNYYNTAIDVLGDTTIQNCYIANCAAPVRARGNVTIINSTLYGGSVANLINMGGVVTLENVTTANYDDGRALVGMGIVFHPDATESAKLVLKGTLTQYNFLNEKSKPTDSYAVKIYEVMFGSSCSKYHFGSSPNRYVNTGIASLTDKVEFDSLTDTANTNYAKTEVSVNGKNGWVYTQLNTSGTVNNNCPEYKPTTQGAVPPSYSFDYTNKNYVAKTDGSNDYCYEENGKVNISMDQGDTFKWDTSILTIGKGITNYDVSMNGTDYTGKSIAFNTAGDYTVTYTYTDDNNYKLVDGNITTYSVTYTKTVNITVAVVKATTKHAEFTMGSSNQGTEKITVGNKTYISASGVSHDNSKWSYITVDGTKIFYPIVEAEIVSKKTAYFYVFKDVITITDYANGGTGTATTYKSSTTTMPSGLSVVKGHYNAFSKISNNWSTLTDANLTYTGASNVFKYAGSNSASSTPTTRSNALCFKSPDVTNARDEYYTIVQYSYLDEAGSTYYYYVGYHMAAKADGGGCVTPDTLITLADGSQKPINQVTYADQILVWDFVTGKYVAKSSSIVMNHGYDLYDVVTLNFADGTTVNTINGHGFFDAQENKFVILNKNNVSQYIGHSFVKDADEMTTTELVSYSIKTEYTESWSVLTSEQYNCVLGGMLTITPAEVEGSAEFLMPYEIGADMKYDEAKMQADIEMYGLYTYADFAEYCTYEQFVALGLENFKVSVAKGYITWDEIIFLLDLHMN